MSDLLKGNKVQKTAYRNYKNNNPWPVNDTWHYATHLIIEKFVSNWVILTIVPSSFKVVSIKRYSFIPEHNTLSIKSFPLSLGDILIDFKHLDI